MGAAGVITWRIEMGKGLFLVSLLALAIACKSKGSADESRVPEGDARATADVGREPIERALLSLGIEGAVRRANLNVKADRVYLLSDLILIESGADKSGKGSVWALRRSNLNPVWKSRLEEASAYPATENADSVMLVSPHMLHVFDKAGGNKVMQFVGGSLDGHARPAMVLPFTPTGSATAQNDTIYMASLGSAANNKTLESFSIVTGSRGWGYRTSSDVYLPPIVGGPSGDPKLYFVTRTGHMTCLDAMNYGYRPSGPRWEELLEAGVTYPFTVTADRRGRVGGIFVVDNEGMVYCLDRITGARLWSNATGRKAVGGPRVFGNVVVVKMNDGLLGFDADNVVYTIGVVAGPDKGASLWVRTGHGKTIGRGDKVDVNLSDAAVGGTTVTFKVEGEVLTALAEGGQMSVDGGEGTQRAVVRAGSRISVGGTTLVVNDRGSAPLWVSLPYDEIVGRVGDKLIARTGSTLTTVNARTGEQIGEAVQFPGARFFPANPYDGNVYVIGGGGVVYALFPR